MKEKEPIYSGGTTSDVSQKKTVLFCACILLMDISNLISTIIIFMSTILLLEKIQFHVVLWTPQPNPGFQLLYNISSSTSAIITILPVMDNYMTFNFLLQTKLK